MSGVKGVCFFYNIEVLKYIAVGLVNTAITAIIIYFCMSVGFGVYSSNALGYFLGVIISYFLNSFVTFKAPLSWRRLVKFVVVCLFCWALNIATIHLYLSFFSGGTYLSQLIGMIVYTLAGFIVNKLWVMK